MPSGPVYHTALYGAVPPDHVPVIVIDWPLSIGAFEGVNEEIDRGDDGVTNAYTFAITNVSIIKENVIGSDL